MAKVQIKIKPEPMETIQIGIPASYKLRYQALNDSATKHRINLDWAGAIVELIEEAEEKVKNEVLKTQTNTGTNGTVAGLR